jgi:hypothetical protein
MDEKRSQCDRIKCERDSQYYAVSPRGDADGWFCYWHIPNLWIAEVA